MLKDLTGMGNSGGGLLVFGVREDENESGVPSGFSYLVDRTLVGVLEDIVRSSVRPPLLMEFQILDHNDDGFVLAVETMRSPLGPYMVEGYGDARYYIRQGTRTAPMTEQQVRDAYLLAARGREHRPHLWEEHHLPLRLDAEQPWLAVSSLPEEPLQEVFNPATTPIEDLPKPRDVGVHSEIGGYAAALSGSSLQIWADGVYGDDSYGERSPTSVFRLHRDGATGLGVALVSKLDLAWLARRVNSQLVFLAHLWSKLTIRTPIELHVEISGLAGAAVEPGSFYESRPVRQPPGVVVNSVALRRTLLASELLKASTRHALVRDFSDRLYQAFGYPKGDLHFRVGWLYGPTGEPLGFSIGGRGIWDGAGEQRAYVYDSGRVTSYVRDGVLVGWFVDGVLLDDQGRAFATLEMATGTGLPDDFLQSAVFQKVKYTVRGGVAGEPLEETSDLQPPRAQGMWSPQSLEDRLRAE